VALCAGSEIHIQISLPASEAEELNGSNVVLLSKRTARKVMDDLCQKPGKTDSRKLLITN
jgi:hypothetical protein